MDRSKSSARARRPVVEPVNRAEEFDDAEDQDLETQPKRGRGARLMAGARDLAQNVGQSTADAAQSTIGAARGLASGAADAAQSTIGAARGLASGAADAAGSLAGKVRENPWPTLLIGAGATWLAVDAIRGRSSEGSANRGGTRSRDTERSVVRGAVSKVARAGRAAGEQIEDFVRDRPLLAGAATLGIAMAVGIALPSSVTENDVLGEARDTVVRRAKEAAQGTVRKMRDVTDTIERMGPFGGGSSSGGRGSGGRGSRG